MEEVVYIRMRQRVQAPPDSLVKLGDLAQIVTSEQLKKEISALPIHLICKSDQNIVVIDVMRVIQAIQNYNESIDVQSIGPTQSIVEVMYKPRQFTIGLLASVWILLFIGAGMTIMNFHEDVSMQEVHQELYYIITGTKVEKPLLLQIPYSLGLGIGMILFFNHLFRKRLNEEPSPLEVEMFKYQMDLDQYVMIKENKESMKKIEPDR
ncbi:stage V sporulation protein AA [Bacillus sp. Marseille-P3661]|uniref:stage V sporulation protein AA n=1 Tax=Bacillus sp. Marseille-P3661 TaxID=1936234 RepID=UPI000C839A12|nr:stage V sporulation protein AA [Bacillus sp. Marseille-P3661]